MTQTPAGWYPDPSGASVTPHLRYWDGAAWTEHLAPVPAPAPVPAYGVPSAGPTTPDGVPLAGWGWRLLGYVVDSLILGVPTALLSLPWQIRMQRRLQDFTTPVGPDGQPDMGRFWHEYLHQMRGLAAFEVVAVLLVVTYLAVMLRWRGATVGHLVTGLQVRLRERPGRLPWSAIGLRVLVLVGLGAVPYVFLAAGWWPVAIVTGLAVALFGLLNALWPLWDDKRQALHDKAARTNVVKVR